MAHLLSDPDVLDEDCPWGCGQPIRHGRSDRCPPTKQAGSPMVWANGPDVALGSERQLRGDLNALRSMLADSDDWRCRKFLKARIVTIEATRFQRSRDRASGAP